MENIAQLVKQLALLPNETQWVEFKENNSDPQMIGEDISALANAAAYCERDYAYLIWGVNDATHDITGTDFEPESKKKGNQPLEIWLRTQLSENASYEFSSDKIGNNTVVVLIINRAIDRTVMFQKTEYIRVGSCTKKLNEVPSMKAQLWDRLRSDVFEDMSAMSHLELQTALQLLDFDPYYELQHMAVPASLETVAYHLKEDHIIDMEEDGSYSITNLGALLLAKRLNQFPSVSRKALRVVQYRGSNRLEIIREITGGKGYAVGYENAIQYIEALLPAREIIEEGLRRTELAYPSLAIREVVANALIHQDLNIRGTGPLIEIFSDRIEVTNPGRPLVDIYRIVDNPPKSRNEKMAALMRRFHICEESGTGWDKIILSSERAHLPAPKIEIYEENMRVTMFSIRAFNDIDQKDKLWACYMHACVRFVEGKQMTNASLRERFGLPDSGASQISRLIKAAIEIKLIKPFDPTTAPRYMRYIPIWA